MRLQIIILNKKCNKQLLLLYFVYLYSSIIFSTIYFDNFSKVTSSLITVINIIIAAGISVFAIKYIAKDFNSTQNIKNNSNSKLFLVFFSICILASIINGNGFNKFNNIYFIIHSAIFFFLILQDNYIKVINYIILIILIALSLISLISIIMFLSNKLNITQNFKSEKIKELFFHSARVNGRWYTILSNPNTFGHLISMTFFLAIIPLVTIKRNLYKILIVVMQFLNVITFFFAGSRGSFVAVSAGLICSSIFLINYIIKHRKWKIIKILLISLASFMLLILILLKNTNLQTFILNSILRTKSLTTGTGRLDTWTNLLKLPFFTNLFGFNDNYLYHYLKNLDAYFPQGFINNTGRAHNMFLEVLVSYGAIAFIIFIICIVKTLIQSYKNYKELDQQSYFLFIIFFIQFITILAGGMFEQLPLFSLSTHALIFMFVWANLLSLTDKGKANK